MVQASDPDDPRGLIRESYRMEGIGPAECRSIFLDWATTIPGDDLRPRVARLLAERPEGHPMTAVLRAALDPPARTGRRGGWRARRTPS